MGVRIFCMMLFGFTLAMWAQIPEMKYVSEWSKFGMHVFYTSATLLLLYGFITGKAPS